MGWLWLGYHYMAITFLPFLHVIMVRLGNHQMTKCIWSTSLMVAITHAKEIAAGL